MSAQGELNPKCHILNFSHDEENVSTFTFLINEVRFHVITDPHRLGRQGDIGRKTKRQYLQKLNRLRAQGEPSESAEDNLDCERPSPSTKSESSGPHTPKQFDNSGQSEPAVHEGDYARNLTEEDVKEKENLNNQSDETALQSDISVQNWILSWFGEQVEKLAPATTTEKSKTIRDWYSGKVYFFELGVKDDQICPVELDGDEELWRRIQGLVPRLPLPKYLREYGIPWIKPEDVEVLTESATPEPLHPSTVRVYNDTYFFKAVDNMQPQPIKREIKILRKIEKIGLDKTMRVPKVHGFVGFEGSKTEAMGFLLTNIEEPTPLTILLDSKVSQERRDKWAQESERMVKLLHENDIIWGDAKADNFMVDKNDDLWIIDFGGSYTEGWIDPELMETKEGDEMGVEKIVNALEDPDINTLDEDDYDVCQDKPRSGPSDEEKGSKKRKYIQEDEQSDSEHPKRRRQSNGP